MTSVRLRSFIPRIPPAPPRALLFAFAAFVALTATSARAQQDNAATVEGLFADGKRLMSAGNAAEACPKFLASYNLEHRVGTVLNLAACYEKNGQLASAWARFVEAQTLATRANQVERATFAAQHAAALEPRRSTLTIVVDRAPAGLVVRRDGVVIEPAAYGVSVPIDGGAHALEATAPGKRAITATVGLKAEADRQTYTIHLADAPAALADGAPKSSPPHRAQARTILGAGVAGVGAITAAVGIAFGVQALSKNSESNAEGHCAGNVCDPAGYAARNTARSDGDVSSVLIGAGAAAVVGGGLLWLTAPSGNVGPRSEARVVVDVGPTGIAVRGVF